MRFIIVVGITPRLGVGAGRCNTHNTPLYNLFFPPSLDSHTPFCVCMHTVSLYTERERPVTMGRVNWACLTPFSTRYCFVLWKSTHTSRHFLASRADELLVFCAARWLRVQQRLKKKTGSCTCVDGAQFSLSFLCVQRPADIAAELSLCLQQQYSSSITKYSGNATESINYRSARGKTKKKKSRANRIKTRNCRLPFLYIEKCRYNQKILYIYLKLRANPASCCCLLRAHTHTHTRQLAGPITRGTLPHLPILSFFLSYIFTSSQQQKRAHT